MKKYAVIMLTGVCALATLPAMGAVIESWDAREFGNGSWTGTNGAIINANIGTGATTAYRASGADTYQVVNFDGASDLISAAGNPIGGLKTYSVSIAYNFNAVADIYDGGGNPGLTKVWKYNGLLGWEVPLGGQGELYVGGYNGADGNHLAVNADIGGSPIDAGLGTTGLHVLTYVVEQVGTTDDYTHQAFIDGMETGAAVTNTYNALAIANGMDSSAFRVGSIQGGAGTGTYLTGDIAKIAFYDEALTTGDTVSGFLVAVPEPATLGLVGAFSLIILASRRIFQI